MEKLADYAIAMHPSHEPEPLTPGPDPSGAFFVALPVRRAQRPEPGGNAAPVLPVAPATPVAPVAPVPAPPAEETGYSVLLTPPAAAQQSADVSQTPTPQPTESVEGVLLEALELRREVGKGKVILQNVSLVARPREFVAVVGGSGAGKSTLLGALSGFRPATSGTVMVDGASLYEHFDTLRALIGYVPQDDIIHKELTVERALGYAAELRLPSDWTPAQRAARVDEVIAELGLQDHRGTVVSSLSGGQRKRVSIGVELLTRPRLFFLDEPTSGLDPGTETRMMALMRQLADQGRTVILITHATRNIAMCDKVLFLVRGGRVAFYGTPQAALHYFGVKEIEEIYDLLEQRRTPEEWERGYRNSKLYQTEIAGRIEHKNGAIQPAATQQRPDPAAERRENLRQFGILTRRYGEIVLRDRKNLIILLAQAPAIGLLLWALFAGNVFSRPADEWLYLPRLSNQPVLLSANAGLRNCASLNLPSTCTYSQVAESLMNKQRQQGGSGSGGALPSELVFYKGQDCSTLKLGPNCAQDSTGGNGHAGKAAQLLFILAATAVWLGTLNAIREISKEDAIYRRERMVNLRVLPYIASKFAVLLGLVLVQSTLLFIVAALHVGFPGGGAFGIWLALAMGATAAVAIALAVSAAVSNPDRAVFAAPLIMLPQILLAGLLVPVSGLGIAQPLAGLITTRWAYEAAGRAAGVVDTAAFPPSFQYRAALSGSTFISLLWLLAIVAAGTGLAVVLQKRKDHR